jgi:hypothetical protein
MGGPQAEAGSAGWLAQSGASRKGYPLRRDSVGFATKPSVKTEPQGLARTGVGRRVSIETPAIGGKNGPGLATGTELGSCSFGRAAFALLMDRGVTSATEICILGIKAYDEQSWGVRDETDLNRGFREAQIRFRRCGADAAVAENR